MKNSKPLRFLGRLAASSGVPPSVLLTWSDADLAFMRTYDAVEPLGGPTAEQLGILACLTARSNSLKDFMPLQSIERIVLPASEAERRRKYLEVREAFIAMFAKMARAGTLTQEGSD